MPDIPPKYVKYISWLIISMLSVFFAETISGSFIYPFFSPWGILVLIPLYGLHTLVLAYIVFSFGKPRLYTLFIAGAIFGLYEAYITKVLWSPPWGAQIFGGGVALVELVVLVLWWHPWMAFIVPLFVSEAAISRSREIWGGLPVKVQRLFNSKKNVYIALVSFAAFFGFMQSANTGSILNAVSAPIAAFLIMALVWLFRNKTKGAEYNFMDLLPDKKEFLLLSGALIILYIILTLIIRPEEMPGIGPQLLIVLIYVFLFGLLYLSLKKSKSIGTYMAESPAIRLTYRLSVVLAICIGIFSLAGSITNTGIIAALAGWLILAPLGIVLMVFCIKDALTQ
jgi:hypothetical protein